MRILAQSSTTELQKQQQQQRRTTAGVTKQITDVTKIRTTTYTLTTPKMSDADFRVVDRRKPRKLWSTLDRPTFNVDLLKANLADDGNEECQLDMAKKLLKKPDDGLEDSPQMRERSRLAVYWLIKSSEQGNEEATSLLHQCAISGEGITVQNISDVRSCISTPRNDKLVFKAARLLYEKLSNGEEFITTAQLNGVIAAWKLRSSPESNSTQSTINDDDNLNMTFTVDDESDSEMHQTLNSPDVDRMKSMRQPNDVVKLTKNDLLKLASSYNKGEIPRIAIDCDTKQNQRYTNWNLQSLAHAFLLQLLLLSLVTKALTLHSVLIILASLLILWTAFNFIMWRKKLLIFEDWTIAFKCVLNNRPYDNMTSRNKLWSKRIRPLTLTNFGCLCALYVLDCPPFTNFILAAVTVAAILHGILYENFAWQTKFLMFTTIVFSKSLANFHEEVFSHVSNYTKDLLFSDMQTDGSSSFFLLQDYEEWTIAALNIQMIFMIVNLVIISASYVLSNDNTKITSFWEQCVLLGHLIQADAAVVALTVNELYVCIGVTIIVLVFFLLLEGNKDLWKIVLGTVLTIIFVLGTVITLVMISNSHAITKDENAAANQRVTWDEYSAKCHRKAWKEQTIPETQIKCTLMYASSPTLVSWTGRISNVKISHMTPRPYSKFKQRSKSATASTDDDETTRVGGVTFEILLNLENPPGLDEGGHSWQSFLTGGGDEKQLNIVSIFISTRGIIGSKEKLKVIRQILSFRVGDQIQVDGKLVNGFGGLKPEIGKISAIKCVECSKVSRGEKFLFTSKSLIFDFLDPFEKYLGSQLVLLLSELEVSVFSLFL